MLVSKPAAPQVVAEAVPLHEAVYLNQTSLLIAVPPPSLHEAGIALAEFVAPKVLNAVDASPTAVAPEHSLFAGAGVVTLKFSE